MIIISIIVYSSSELFEIENSAIFYREFYPARYTCIIIFVIITWSKSAVIMEKISYEKKFDKIWCVEKSQKKPHRVAANIILFS